MLVSFANIQGVTKIVIHTFYLFFPCRKRSGLGGQAYRGYSTMFSFYVLLILTTYQLREFDGETFETKIIAAPLVNFLH